MEEVELGHSRRLGPVYWIDYPDGIHRMVHDGVLRVAVVYRTLALGMASQQAQPGPCGGSRARARHCLLDVSWERRTQAHTGQRQRYPAVTVEVAEHGPVEFDIRRGADDPPIGPS